MNKFWSLTQRFAIYTVIAAFALVSFSCGSDDDEKKVDCDEIEEELDQLADDFFGAIDDGDCADIEKYYEDAVDAFTKGEDCDYVQDILDNGDFEDLDEFLDNLENIKDQALNDNEC